MNSIWIGTNWKMTKTIVEGIEYTKTLKNISKQISSRINLFLIPSFTAISPVNESVKDTNILVGAQNMHWEDSGAYTGEISPRMLNEIGIDIIELGHSERRQYYNETDTDVNKKVLAALEYDIKPLICIGENIKEKETDISKEVLSAQLKVCLQNVSEDQVSQVLIAYEPIWAIGEHGVSAKVEYISSIHSFLRKTLVDLYGDTGMSIPLLFGGSVNKNNFKDYIDISNVNGLFIGRAAWDIESFNVILKELSAYMHHRN